MMQVWLKRIGSEVVRRRDSEKQEAFADRIKISRATLSVIENGTHGYGVEPLLQVLAGVDSDPVISLLEISKDLNSLDAKTVKLVRLLVEALNDGRRSLAETLVGSLEMASLSQRKPRKGN